MSFVAPLIASPIDDAVVGAAIGGGGAVGLTATSSGRRATFRRRGGDPVAALYGVSGWRGWPYGTAPQEQIGIYGDQLLHQFPAYWPDQQRRQGVEGLVPLYMTPGVSVLPDFERSQRRAYQPGPQLVGSKVSGLVGPLNANNMTARVTAAQIRQSGLQAVSWASQLSEG